MTRAAGRVAAMLRRCSVAWWIVLVGVVGSAVLARRGAGQGTVPGADSGRARSARPYAALGERPVPVLHDVAVGAAFFAGAAAISPFDSRLAVAAQRPWVQRSTVLRDGANVFDAVGNPGTIIVTLGLFGGGWLAHDRNVAALGLHSGEAFVLSGAITELLGGFSGRARPLVDIHHPGQFAFGKGFRADPWSSLPSEHVTASFALASVAGAEASRRWPHAARWITPAAYTIASMVGLARVYKNKHWASDVLTGAGIGTATGLLVVHYTEAYPNNVVDRWLLP